MEHKIILKCRVCLGEFDEEKMFDLFAESSIGLAAEQIDNGSDDRKRLVEKLEFCCGVRIRQSSEMPTKICIKCFDMTRIWFNFRQMCLNSQVYLESLCKDRAKPPELEGENDGDYLEFLLEDLQIFRTDARNSTDDLDEPVIDDCEEPNDNFVEENEDEDTNEYIEAIPYEAVESDPEFENIIDNIKKEQEQENKLEEQEQGKNKQKKLRKYNAPKVKYRPPSPSSYMCSICGNVYTKKASFTYHMSLHSEVKPHECELCGKAFRQVCELKNHMRRHTGEKPYKCSYCDRHFTDRSEKHRHERVHTNTRPYLCKVCGKSFMYSAILKNHSKLHTGEKDYNCLVCQKAFTLQHQLKAHLQTITHKQKEAQFVNAGYEVVYE